MPIPGERTTPEATELQALLARMVGAGVGLAAIEVSSHALVMHRVDGTRFAAACFTNLSHDHLDFHAGLEEYFEAKALLFDPARTDAAATNLDDPHGVEIARRAEAAGLAVLGFGLDAPAAAVRAEGLDAGPGGNRFRLVTPYGSAARSTRRWSGGSTPPTPWRRRPPPWPPASTSTRWPPGCRRRSSCPGRMERIEAGQPFPVLVDYAHTPDGLEQVLRAARPLVDDSDGRLVVVFGCGGDRDRAKRPAMGKAAAGLADVIVVTSDNPRSEDPVAIIDEVVAGVPSGVHPIVEPDRRAAIGDRPRRPAAPGTSWSWPARATSRARRPAGSPCRSTTGSSPGRSWPGSAGTRRTGWRREADPGRDRRGHRRADPGRRSRRRRHAPIPSTPAPWPRARCSWPCGRSATGTTSWPTPSTAAPPAPSCPGLCPEGSRAAGAGRRHRRRPHRPRAGRPRRGWPACRSSASPAAPARPRPRT